MPRSDTPHILIVGQGLAGSHVALEAIRRGYQVTVVDRDRGMSSSRISAGLLNPAAGRRFSLHPESWRQMQTALSVYRYWEKAWEIQLLDKRKMWRPFLDDKERFHFQKRKGYLPADRLMQKQQYRDAGESNQPDLIPSNWSQLDAVRIDPIYLLNVPLFLDRARETIERHGRWMAGWVEYRDLSPSQQHCYWFGERFDFVCFAQGAFLGENPLFDWVPFQISEGCILDINPSPLPLSTDWVLNYKHWYFNDGRGKARLGATALPPVSRIANPITNPTANLSDAAITAMLKTYGLDVGRLANQVTLHTGYRPRLPDNQPLVGFHPAYPSLAVVGATGGRGGILTPWLALRLFACKDHQLALPTNVNCNRNFPF